MVSEILTPIIMRWLRKRFGGVTPEMLLSNHEVAEIRPVVRRARRVALPVSLVCWLVVGGAMAWGAVEWRSALEGPAPGAVLDERVGLRWGFFGFTGAMLAGTLAGWIYERLIRRQFGTAGSLYDCYVATQSGFTPRRSMLIVCVVMAMLAPWMILAGWNAGTRVHANGIDTDNGLLGRQQIAFSDVADVRCYDRFKKGGPSRPNVRIRTRSGDEVNISRDSRARPTAIAVATYISQRAGVAVATADSRK